MALVTLQRVINTQPEYDIIWVARDGKEAVEKTQDNCPDIILMDLIMPVMDGVEATKLIMKKHSCAILIVTASVGKNFEMVYDAMGYGAIDAVKTPVMGLEGDITSTGEGLIRKMRLIRLLHKSNVAVVTKPTKKTNETPKTNYQKDFPLLSVGASTGGPGVLNEILATLGHIPTVAIVIIQHIDVQFIKGLETWLAKDTGCAVKIAEEGEKPKPGNVYLASSHGHLVLTKNKEFAYTKDTNRFYSPSVDIFFESASNNWQGKMMGVILSGMGKDGAQGLLSFKNKGHTTMVQNKESAVIYGMPKASLDIGAAIQTGTPRDISKAIQTWIKIN